MSNFQSTSRALDQLLGYSKPQDYADALTDMWESWLTDERNDNATATERAAKWNLYKNLRLFLQQIGN